LFLLQTGVKKRQKLKLKTNIVIEPSSVNCLSKKSIADCLQTRPIDYSSRLVNIRGELETELVLKIDRALKIVFAL